MEKIEKEQFVFVTSEMVNFEKKKSLYQKTVEFCQKTINVVVKKWKRVQKCLKKT